MTYTVARSFVRRATNFTIGAVTFEAPDGAFKLNDKTLPTSSVEHLLNFALQSLQDAYAGADTDEDAKARFEDKLTRIIEGKLGQRAASVAVSDETRWARTILRPIVKSMLGQQWKDADEEQRVAWLDEAYAGLGKDDLVKVQTLINENIQQEKKKKGLGITVKLSK